MGPRFLHLLFLHSVGFQIFRLLEVYSSIRIRKYVLANVIRVEVHINKRFLLAADVGKTNEIELITVITMC